MPNYAAADVSAYIKAAPKEARAHLEAIRAAVKSALPKAEEKIGYGKPYYKSGRWLVGFDTYTRHIGFEIWEGQLSADVRATLEKKGYKTGNKTFQIRFDQAVPEAMIKKIAKAQAKLAAAKVAAKKK